MEAETVRNDLKRWLRLALLSLIISLCAAAAAAESSVQLNEVMLSTAKFEGGKAYEWIELHNPGSGAVSLRNWQLTYERKGETQTYTMPGGMKIDSNGGPLNGAEFTM